MNKLILRSLSAVVLMFVMGLGFANSTKNDPNVFCVRFFNTSSTDTYNNTRITFYGDQGLESQTYRPVTLPPGQVMGHGQGSTSSQSLYATVTFNKPDGTLQTCTSARVPVTGYPRIGIAYDGKNCLPAAAPDINCN